MGVSLAKTESVSFYPGMARVLQTIAKMDAHHRLLLGFIVAALVGLERNGLRFRKRNSHS